MDIIVDALREITGKRARCGLRRQSEAPMANKKGWRKGGRRFIRLWMNVKCSQAY
jgi:hypothetical protein